MGVTINGTAAASGEVVAPRLAARIDRVVFLDVMSPTQRDDVGGVVRIVTVTNGYDVVGFEARCPVAPDAPVFVAGEHRDTGGLPTWSAELVMMAAHLRITP